ncbi:MAG: DNA alkylation repair protein [Pseudomonadota bacterium]
MHPRVPAIVAELTSKGTEARKAAFQRTAPSALRSLGVAVPDLRPISKALIKEHRQAPPGEVKTLAFALVWEGSFEARQVGYELIAGHRATLASLTRAELLALGEGMDNWATADMYAEMIVGVSWLRGHVDDALIMGFTRSPDRWWRRSALVATVALNKKARGGKGDPTRTLPVCRALVADPDDMVVKALSWSLRELLEWEPGLVADFMLEHAAVIASRVKREVGNKLRTGKKSGQ